MDPWQRRLGRLLLAVFLATLLSPNFAWEAVASDAHHPWAQDAAEAVHYREFSSGTTGSHDHHDSHVCAGHQFGHLPVHICRGFVPVLPLEGAGILSEPVAPDAPGFFNTPLRPPRSLSFA